MNGRLCILLLVIASSARALGGDVGNRLTYLDEFADPYYVHLHTPKLVTPQWVGEDGVQAAFVLAIDDMSNAAKYESFLRPILQRLKQIDGRAPVSIMTTSIDPQLPQLQKWLDEGLSIEPHTYDHPCPCLQGGQLAKAKSTYDTCIDLLAKIPNTRPVAFRMPCCDSMNSVSPRYFAEVFNKKTPAGNFLSIDTSVFQLFTPDDPSLPRGLVVDPDGNEKFRKYLPNDRLMVNYVENYPYPYVIAKKCWEFPCLMPSDWVGQHRNGKCNPQTVEDYKAAIDATVVKQGVFALCFHPHGWISDAQVVELIDYAVTRYGESIKFLNFQEVQQRLDQNLLAGQPLRTADGGDNGTRLCDVDNDGYMDVVTGNPSAMHTRIWSPDQGRWHTMPFPARLIEDADGTLRGTGLRFGVLQASGCASVLVYSETAAGLWHFDGNHWTADATGLAGLPSDEPIATSIDGRDHGVRLRDLDGDGICELLVSNPDQRAIFRLDRDGWRQTSIDLPEGLTIVDAQGRDGGLRFVDLNDDGHDDVVFSNAQRYAAYAFESLADGWSRKIMDAPRSEGHPLPMIVRGDGTNNGAWFSYHHMWVQNEDTGGSLPDHVDRRHIVDDFQFDR
jgi:hypothetical protein